MKRYTLAFILIILSASASRAQYAALAIDQLAGERYGWAVEYETQSGADKRALSECEKNGGDCHIVLRFRGGCGAYVVERGNNSLYGWGTAGTRAAAEARAMQEARAVGGNDLVVRVWGCNGGELIQSEEGTDMLKGVFYFHFTYSSEYEKRCFITDVMYEPNIAHKSGDTWVLNDNAETVLTPKAQKFYAFADDAVYGFLGENKDKAITRTGVDWQGTNEVKYNNSALNMNLSDRKARIEKGRQSIIKKMKADGYKIIDVDVR